MNTDLFAVTLLLLPPMLFSTAILVGTSRRHGRPAVLYALFGVYFTFGVLLQLVLGWIYFRPEFWSVVGALTLYNLLFFSTILQAGWRHWRARRAGRGRSAPGG